MKKLRIILLLFLTNVLYSQNETGLEICFQLQEYTKNFTTDYEADLALEKILSTIGASKNFILIPCDEIQNAVAITFKGDRYILYDKNFMTEISSITNEWSDLFILAHEVGHHINGHTRDFLLSKVLDSESLENQRNDELEADEWAAFVVSKLGASLNEIENIIELLGSNKNDLYSTHPDKTKRLAAVKKGYENAESQKEVVVVESESISKSNNKVEIDKNLFNQSITSKDRIPPIQIPNAPRWIKVIRSASFKEEKINKWRKLSRLPLKEVFSGESYNLSGLKVIDKELADNLNDPFWVKFEEEHNPEIQIESISVAEPIGQGSENLELQIIQNKFKRSTQYMSAMYLNRSKKYNLPKNYLIDVYLNNFLESPLFEIFEKNDKNIYLNFHFMFDNGVSGVLTTKAPGWRDGMRGYLKEDGPVPIGELFESFKTNESYPWPDMINLSWNQGTSDYHFEVLLTFINNIKKANTLYLKLEEIFLWNGYTDKDKKIFSTSKGVYEDYITRPNYTYKFDLKGSSKALSLEY
jgi:hypothetical protein